MPPRRKLSILDRGRALAWLNDGVTVSMREVARRLQVSSSVVHRLQERFRATTERQTERPRPGRPRCTNKQDGRFQSISTMRERMTTSTTPRRQLMNAVHVNVSASSSRLHEAGLHSRSAAVRLPWTPADCRGPCSVVWAPSALDQAAVVQNPLDRRVSLHCCLHRRQETRLAQGRGALHSRRCSEGRSLWGRISNGVRRHPVQRQNTPLRHSGLPDRPTLQRRIRAPPHATCSAFHGSGRQLAGRQGHIIQSSGRHRLPAAAGDAQDGRARLLS